jgi:hypothetical protein
VSGDDNSEKDGLLRDVAAATTILLNADPDGPTSWEPPPFQYALVAANETRAVFDNPAPLVANDFNGTWDVFAVATGRPLPTLPFADAFELGDLTAWSAYQP